MNTLRKEGTSVTPRVNLDLNSMAFEISGYSRPEDASGFYSDIISWLEAFSAKIITVSAKPDSIIFKFQFIYFNSSSSKYIYDIIMLLGKIRESGVNLTIKWLYDEDDDELFESGEELSDMSGIPFDYEEIRRE